MEQLFEPFCYTKHNKIKKKFLYLSFVVNRLHLYWKNRNLIKYVMIRKSIKVDKEKLHSLLTVGATNMFLLYKLKEYDCRPYIESTSHISRYTSISYYYYYYYYIL